MSADAFAPELPPNSPQIRENPASPTGLRHTLFGFAKRRGGDSNPRYRLRDTTAKAINRGPTKGPGLCGVIYYALESIYGSVMTGGDPMAWYITLKMSVLSMYLPRTGSFWLGSSLEQAYCQGRRR